MRNGSVGVGFFPCGELRLRHLSNRLFQDEKTISGKRADGVGEVFQATDDRGLSLDVARIVWTTGEQDVRAIGDVPGPRALRRLEHGALRMGIYFLEPDLAWVELSQARIKKNAQRQWSTRVRATQEDLDKGAGTNTLRVLYAAGAKQVGARKAILKDAGNRKQYYCATFARTNTLVPVVAYVLTRVLPLLRQHSSEE